MDLEIRMERGWLEHAAMRATLRDVRRWTAAAIAEAQHAQWVDGERATIVNARTLIERVFAAVDETLEFVDAHD